MTGLYPSLVISLAYGASAFIAPTTMTPVAAGAALRRTAAILSSTSARRLHGSRTSMSAEHFDYLVIGGGSGGVASARRAATYDAKVAVVSFTCVGPNPRMCRSHVVWRAHIIHMLLPLMLSKLFPRTVVCSCTELSVGRSVCILTVIGLLLMLFFAGGRNRGERNGWHMCERRLCS